MDLSEYDHVPREHEILRVVSGSVVHGIDIPGTDDDDQLAVFVEPADHVIGLLPDLSTMTFRSQPQNVRSQPGDLDLVRHSLRKYVRLVVRGNPNMLIPIFAPDDMVLASTTLGRSLRTILAECAISQSAVHQHLGYLTDQIRRMTDGRERVTRPELIEQYGYDTKYASHAIRLAIQGHELVTSGRISLPMEPRSRRHVIDVKTGGFAQQEVIDLVSSWRFAIEAALKQTDLPPEPDRATLSAWLTTAHLGYWGWDA